MTIFYTLLAITALFLRLRWYYLHHKPYRITRQRNEQIEFEQREIELKAWLDKMAARPTTQLTIGPDGVLTETEL